MLLSYISVPRYEGPEVDRAVAEKDAKSLFKAGERRLGTDENTFIHIFSERSRAHLAAVSTAYHHTYSTSLIKVCFHNAALSYLFFDPWIWYSEICKIIAGSKKWNIWGFWVCPYDNLTVCWESCEVLRKGIALQLLIFFSKYNPFPEVSGRNAQSRSKRHNYYFLFLLLFPLPWKFSGLLTCLYI